MAGGLLATRTGISELELTRASGERIGVIDLRKPVRLAKDELWPLETDDQAGIELDGAKYFAWWQRTSDEVFRSGKHIALTAGRGGARHAVVQADVEYEGWKARYVLTHGDRRYVLDPRSRGRFDFSLSIEGREIALLRETSSFWTITRKTYALDPASPIDDVVASFALLLALVHHSA